MIVHPVPSIDYNECHPERCDHGICAVINACPRKAFFQEEPYNFPMHLAYRCTGLQDLLKCLSIKSSAGVLEGK